MKVLITGAGGQIGSDLAKLLKERGDHVIATDIAAKPPEGAEVDAWRHLDVTDKNSVISMFRQDRPEVVFHLAAVLSARGEKFPQQTYRVNEIGTFNVLEACREAGVRQLMFCSSIAVFGPGIPDPTPDDTFLRPTTMYGVTKVGGELLGNYYFDRYGFDFRGVRFPGLISAALPGGGTSDYALFMYVDGVRIGAYEAFCKPDTRIPLMYMPDALRALVELSEAPRERLGRCVYNIAAFSPRADEIAKSVERLVPGVRITFRSDPKRQQSLDSWPKVLDDTCAREDWKWKPDFDLEGMTDDLVPKIRTLIEKK
jgi:threonine 3-dehydrogenase